MTNTNTLVLALLLISATAHAAVINAGPTRSYKTPCQAVAAAKAGDTIEVDPGTYTDDFCLLDKNNLTVKGVGGSRPHMKGTVLIPNKKGIFVVPLNVGPITVENIEFSGAKISAADGDNGAGIRMQGSKLTVRNCYFHDNQNGILTGGTANAEVLIELSEFAHNGNAGSGQEHNVYVSGDTQSLTFRYNYTHHAKSGHTLKSRAKINYILFNRIMDEATGFSSYLVDLPQGGRSYIIGNLIQQGPMAENHSAIVSYKGEGATNPELKLYVVNNTMVNDKNTPQTKFIRIHQATEVKVINNMFIGPGTPVNFPNGSSGTAYTNQNNLTPAAPGLVDQAAYDYHLKPTSPAVNAGTNPGSGAGYALTPTEQYVHTAQKQPRPQAGVIDVGAYELGAVPPVDAGPPADSAPAKDSAPAADSTPSTDAAPGSDSAPATDGAPATDSAPATDGAPGGDHGAPASDGAGKGDAPPASAGDRHTASISADDGCRCGVGQTGSGGWPVLAALLLLLWVRRRR
jgi:MYXO-CTERM domain-containing protein